MEVTIQGREKVGGQAWAPGAEQTIPEQGPKTRATVGAQLRPDFLLLLVSRLFCARRPCCLHTVSRSFAGMR